MNDARTELEKKSLQKAMKSNAHGSKSRLQKTSGHKALVSDTAACDSQEAASCSHNNIAGQRKVDSKAPFHPSPLHAVSQCAPLETRPPHSPLSSQLNCEVKEVKSSFSQTKEEASNKKADKYVKEFDAFGEKEPHDRQSSLKLKNASNLYKETPVKDAEVSDRECKNENLDQADENNNFVNDGTTNIPKNDSRDCCTTVPLKKTLVKAEPTLKKAKHRVPFTCKKLKRAKSKESSKPKGAYHSGTCASCVKISVNGGGLQAGNVMSKTQDIQGKAVLKKAKSYVTVYLEESSNQDKGDDGHQSTPGQVPSLSDCLSYGETHSIPSVEASPPDKKTPVQQEQNYLKTAILDTSATQTPSQTHYTTLVEASSKKETPFNQEEQAPDTTDYKLASTHSEAVGSSTVDHSAVTEESFVARDIELSNPFQKYQHQSKVFIFFLFLLEKTFYLHVCAAVEW